MRNSLEHTRQESIRVWADAQRRALHENVRNTPVVPPAQAASGTGAGAVSSSTAVLRLVFNSVEGAQYYVSDLENVSEWNAFFVLPENGNPFTKVEVDETTIFLHGGIDIVMRGDLFDGNDSLIAVDDPDGCVVALGQNVFGDDEEQGSTNLESVNFPAVTTTGYRCFDSCSSLTSVNMPKLEQVGYSCFSGCTSLTSINFPSVIELSYSSFSSCTSLTTVNLPLITNIPGDCFSRCKDITSINIPLCNNIENGSFYEIYGNQISLIANSAVLENEEVYELSINNELTINGNLIVPSFNCSGNLTLGFNTITDADTLVGDSSNVSDWNSFFNHLSWSTPFTGVTINSNSVTLTGGENIVLTKDLFLDDLITDISDAGCVAHVSYKCFDQRDIQSVSLPAITQLYESCFYGCYSLSSIDLPNVTYVGSNCFRNCLSLALIELPALTDFGSYAFSSGRNGSTINLPVLQKVPSSGFPSTNAQSINIPAVTEVASYSFYDCGYLTSINLPLATRIGFYAFYDSYNLTSIELPACTNLGDGVGSFGVFGGIIGKTVQLTVPAALMTCNGGQPDGDIQQLQANNTVTVTQV